MSFASPNCCTVSLTSSPLKPAAILSSQTSPVKPFSWSVTTAKPLTFSNLISFLTPNFSEMPTASTTMFLESIERPHLSSGFFLSTSSIGGAYTFCASCCPAGTVNRFARLVRLPFALPRAFSTTFPPGLSITVIPDSSDTNFWSVSWILLIAVVPSSLPPTTPPSVVVCATMSRISEVSVLICDTSKLGMPVCRPEPTEVSVAFCPPCVMASTHSSRSASTLASDVTPADVGIRNESVFRLVCTKNMSEPFLVTEASPGPSGMMLRALSMSSSL